MKRKTLVTPTTHISKPKKLSEQSFPNAQKKPFSSMTINAHTCTGKCTHSTSCESVQKCFIFFFIPAFEDFIDICTFLLTYTHTHTPQYVSIVTTPHGNAHMSLSHVSLTCLSHASYAQTSKCHYNYLHLDVRMSTLCVAKAAGFAIQAVFATIFYKHIAEQCYISLKQSMHNMICPSLVQQLWFNIYIQFCSNIVMLKSDCWVLNHGP